MSETNDIIKYNQSNITGVMQVYHSLQKNFNVDLFYNFAKNYGSKKILNILSSYGLSEMGISACPNNIDQISKKIINSSTNNSFCLSNLYSTYYYSKYVKNDESNILSEEQKQIVFNCLVKNVSVDIKKLFSLNEMEKQICNKNIILLGIKEKTINQNNYFNKNLIKINQDDIINFKNGFFKKNLFPSLKYAKNEEIIDNKSHFFIEYPKLKNQMSKVYQNIMKKVLLYEANNQQIILSNTLDKGQKQIKEIINEYQSKAGRLSKMIFLNQRLINALSDTPTRISEEDFDYMNK